MRVSVVDALRGTSTFYIGLIYYNLSDEQYWNQTWLPQKENKLKTYRKIKKGSTALKTLQINGLNSKKHNAWMMNLTITHDLPKHP